MHLLGDDFETVPLLVEIFSSVPLLFLCTLSLRVSAHGAALTEKCRAIPSFVNQIPANDIDHNRQYLVRFIQDSSAGFCIRDVKLTQEMFMKQVYVVGALLSATFSALSRLLIWSQPSWHRCGFIKPSALRENRLRAFGKFSSRIPATGSAAPIDGKTKWSLLSKNTILDSGVSQVLQFQVWKAVSMRSTAQRGTMESSKPLPIVSNCRLQTCDLFSALSLSPWVMSVQLTSLPLVKSRVKPLTASKLTVLI